MTERNKTTQPTLSPRWVRLIWFVILAIVAVCSIMLIDARAMTRQRQISRDYPDPPAWMKTDKP